MIRSLRWWRYAVLAVGLMVLGGAQAASVTPCTSGGPVQCPNIGTYGTPALGVLGDNLWLVYQGDSVGTLWETVYNDNGGGWTRPVPLGVDNAIVASGSPALASFNGQLYVAYPTVDAYGYHQVCYNANAGAGFSSANQTCLPISIQGTPSLAASVGTLWLAFRRTDATGVWVEGLWGTRQGETHQFFGQDSFLSGSPSVADFNGQPYVCFTESSAPLFGSTPWCSSLDGAAAVVGTVNMGESPAVTAFNGQFYLVHQAAGLFVNYSLWYASSTNPTSSTAWSLDNDMGIGHVTGSPAVAVYHNLIYWTAPTDNHHVLFGVMNTP